MNISYDPEKRERTLAERGLDFEDAAELFAGSTVDLVDDRADYGEQRWQSYGLLNGRLLMVVWTKRGDARHIISMRKCNDREQSRFGRQLGP
uniref:BrnT family toxin n=1 Tax=uncultured Sphingomonas sp. TaxID=158754 RepID=UPI0025FF645C|nr:BrnT family toxin [uncultured Sphingomonas sp.]